MAISEAQIAAIAAASTRIEQDFARDIRSVPRHIQQQLLAQRICSMSDAVDCPVIAVVYSGALGQGMGREGILAASALASEHAEEAIYGAKRILDRVVADMEQAGLEDNDDNGNAGNHLRVVKNEEEA